MPETCENWRSCNELRLMCPTNAYMLPGTALLSDHQAPREYDIT